MHNLPLLCVFSFGCSLWLEFAPHDSLVINFKNTLHKLPSSLCIFLRLFFVVKFAHLMASNKFQNHIAQTSFFLWYSSFGCFFVVKF